MNRFFFNLMTAGLVTVHGNWEESKVYTYKIETKSAKFSSEPRNEFVGPTSHLHLTLQPLSDNVLIGQFTSAELAELTSENSENYSEAVGSNFKNLPLSRPFKIHLQDGVIESLAVDDSLPAFEVNQLIKIISQFRVDTHGTNVNSRNENNAFYKTTESVGNKCCETIYDISPIPDYLIKSHPEWIPSPEVNENGGAIVEILKFRDTTNCVRKSNLLDVATFIEELGKESTRGNDLTVFESQRMVVSGSLERFTVQSSFAVTKLMNTRWNTTLLADYVNCTLESVESASQLFDLPENLKIIGNLISDFDFKIDDKSSRPQLGKFFLRNFCSIYKPSILVQVSELRSVTLTLAGHGTFRVMLLAMPISVTIGPSQGKSKLVVSWTKAGDFNVEKDVSV